MKEVIVVKKKLCPKCKKSHMTVVKEDKQKRTWKCEDDKKCKHMLTEIMKLPEGFGGEN
jgi:hypothetical protein